MTLVHPATRRSIPTRSHCTHRPTTHAPAASTTPAASATSTPTTDDDRRDDGALLRAGDDASMRVLVDEYAGLVYRVAFNALGRRDLAEEATQETFVRAWRAADQFDEARGGMVPWLTTIAYRVAIDLHRRERRAPVVSLDDVQVTPVVDGRTMESVEAVGRVRDAISTLAPDDAELVRLHHFDGLTYADIGRRLGVPEGTIKSRSFRVRRELVSLLADLAPETARDTLTPSR
jgi:RNA polymerase sigma-70 factor, ECF subfamily